QRPAAVHPGLGLARHEARRTGADRERHRVRVRQRRGNQAGVPGHRSAVRLVDPRRQRHARGDLRARRTHWQGTLVERRSDAPVESLLRHHRRERPRVPRHLRRHTLLVQRRCGGWRDSVNRNVVRLLSDTGCELMKRRLTIVTAYMAIAVATAIPRAQTPKADWLTDGGDPQRTAWQRNETLLTKDTVKAMKLLWKIKLDNQLRQMHNLFPPLVAGSVRTRDGEKEIAVVAGVSDNVYAIDVA